MVYYKDRDVGTYHKWTRPFTLNAFSVELKQPLQKIWKKVMDQYSYSLFSVMPDFVCLCLSPCICHCICFVLFFL